MINLDALSTTHLTHINDVLIATRSLSKQCLQVVKELDSVDLPDSYRDIDHIVVAGMGGSHLGGNLLSSIFESNLDKPLVIKSDYDNPGYIGNRSLVIAVSYSGNTEETLEFARQALSRQAKLICISSGGKLADFAIKHSIPHYTFNDTIHNPSGIPRYGSGYLFTAKLMYLTHLGVIHLPKQDILRLISHLESQLSRFDISVPLDKNPAKQTALKFSGHAVVLFASQHLLGPAYIFKNQLNESAKNQSFIFDIPELNHHLLEGLSHPKGLRRYLHILFLDSNLYHPRNRLRHQITQDILTQLRFNHSVFIPNSKSALLQSFECLAFSSFSVIYLSLLNHEIPGPIPWVDFLKQELAKSKQ